MLYYSFLLSLLLIVVRIRMCFCDPPPAHAGYIIKKKRENGQGLGVIQTPTKGKEKRLY